MPELPEVETMRRGVACCAGSVIRDVQYVGSNLKPIQVLPSREVFRRSVQGRTIAAVDRIGKRVVLVLDSGDRIVVEPRMTGRVLLSDPPNQSHLRLVFHLEPPSKPAQFSSRSRRRLRPCSGRTDRGRPTRLLFWDTRGLGVVSLLPPERLEAELGAEKLGPDALEISVEELQNRLGNSHRAIKVALLDQSVLAGVGNLYASEILHRARLHPALSCNRLLPRHWKQLHRAMQEILEAAIFHQGSTLADGNYRNAQNEAGRYQEHHAVYQRAGQTCPRCRRAKVVRIVQAQRSTFYCPVCQKPPRDWRADSRPE
jgi:formamidopyrimidine-DNA glycosylase